MAAIPLPQINTNNVVVVTNIAYGAVGDGVTTNTSAIQNAINAAAAGVATNGLSGGTVKIPPGTYLSGPLTLKSCVNLQIDTGAMLQMLPYASFPSNTDFISASKLHDIEISGTGTIDGQGGPWWATNNATSGGITRPKAMFAPSTCTNILVCDVTLQNPPNTHISFRSVCMNVTVDHININTPNGTPNTDGIDCSAANVLIQNSHITDGDDHIAMGDGHVGSFNYNITITNCLFGTGHGVSIGSYTTGGVSNLLVIDCVWTNGSTGIKVKSDIDRGGVMQNLRYFNLAMTNTQIPIYFYMYYTNSGTSSGVPFAKAATYPVLPLTSTFPIYKNILISNLTAVSAGGYSASIIWGRPESPITNMVLDHVNITASKYFNVYNARGVQFIDSKITASTTTNFGLFNADLIISNRAPSANFVLVDGITTNGYGNTLAFYNAQASLANTNGLDDGPLTVAASIFTVSNNLAMTASGIFNFSPGTNTTLIAVKGNLRLGGSVNISSGDGFTNGIYTLMNCTGSMSGSVPALGSVPAGYTYTLSANASKQMILTVTLPAPANLVAAATNLQINLKWNLVVGATGYDLKRGTVGGIYPIIYSGLTATNYADISVANGVNYFYVVSTVGAGGESSNSVQVVAVPLPSNQPTNINWLAVGGQMQLSWPQDHLGWRLQMQTNDLSAGLGTNWITVPDSINITSTNITMNPANGSVFFRLTYP